jgi:hypothetical protein
MIIDIDPNMMTYAMPPISRSAATDSSGNVLVTGQFGSTIRLGSATLTAVESDMYVAKLGPTGSVLWAVNFASQDPNTVGMGLPYMEPIGITVDSAGDVIVVARAGDFTSLVFSPSITLTLQGSGTNMVVIKLNGANGQALWARNFGGDNNSEAK